MDTNEIDVASLKQHFTDEELQGVIPQEETAEEKPAEEPAQEEQPQTEEEPVEEVKEQPAPDSEKVSKHVPYDRFREVNEKAKALAAELAALKAQQVTPKQEQKPVFEQQPSPAQQNNADARAKYFATLSSNADKEAREIYGIADADLTELQFTDNAKYQAYLDTRATIVQETHAEHMKAFHVRQQNEAYVAKLQQDPLFAPVYQYANEAMQDLPGRDLLKFKEAEMRVTQFCGTDADFALLDKYMADYKAKFLAAQGQAPAPQQQAQPHKAPLDKAEGLPRANNLSGAKSAAMSWAQVEQLIRDGKADQIPRDMLAQIDPKLIE